jgi:spore coat polysaccharide biosynthesis predicted glycosyltransferase SpsG
MLTSGNPIVFIVRSSSRDGLGHLARSLSVLRELRTLHQVQLLLLGDGLARHLVESADVAWSACESDDAAVDAVLLTGAQLVVFDTLTFDAASFSRLPHGVITVSLSPVFNRLEEVHYLFHRTMKRDPTWPDCGSFPMVHRGLHFTVLPRWLKRTTTSLYREHLTEPHLGVAISMGGSDATNRTLQLLKAFRQCRAKLVLFVAVGDAYTHSYEELIAAATEHRQEIILLRSNESMWRILKNTVALILCAGGLSSYESAYIGLPSINILQNADWTYLVEELAEAGACHVVPPGDASLAQAVTLVETLAENREDLVAMHLATKGLIPEGGSRRIAIQLNAFLTADHPVALPLDDPKELTTLCSE